MPHSMTARFFELHSNHTVMLTVAHASYIWLQPNGDEFVELHYTAPTRFYKRIFTVVRVVCCQLMTQAFRKTHKHTLHTHCCPDEERVKIKRGTTSFCFQVQLFTNRKHSSEQCLPVSKGNGVPPTATASVSPPSDSSHFCRMDETTDKVCTPRTGSLCSRDYRILPTAPIRAATLLFAFLRPFCSSFFLSHARRGGGGGIFLYPVYSQEGEATSVARH